MGSGQQGTKNTMVRLFFHYVRGFGKYNRKPSCGVTFGSVSPQPAVCRPWDIHHCDQETPRIPKIYRSVGVRKIKKIAAPEFRVWSPTTLLGQALTSLTTVDRTGNGAFW